MQFHEIADVFPMMNSSQMAELVDDIRANGLRHPVLVFEDKVLDGRNRYKACGLAGVAVTTIEYTGDWDAAVKLVASENIHRRHLSNNERAFAAERLATLAEGRPKTGSIEPVSLARAAELTGTGRESAKRARVVRERGVPELVEAAQTNEIAVSTAAELTKLAPEEQRAVIAAGPQAARAAARAVRDTPAPAPGEPEQGGRRVANGNQFVIRLVGMVRVLESSAQELAAGKATVPTPQVDLALKAIARLKSGADWLNTLIAGNGFSDEALSTWLADGGDQ